MDVVQLVHRVDGQHHLHQVKFSHVLGQAVLELAKKSEQIPADVVVHHQVLQREKGEKRRPTSDR